MKEKLERKLLKIAECIFDKASKKDKLKSIGLNSGGFGMLLFMLYFSRYTSNRLYILN